MADGIVNLTGQEGEVRMVIQIKRAATGKTETVELTGKVTSDGSDTLDSSTKRCD